MMLYLHFLQVACKSWYGQGVLGVYDISKTSLLPAYVGKYNMDQLIQCYLRASLFIPPMLHTHSSKNTHLANSQRQSNRITTEYESYSIISITFSVFTLLRINFVLISHVHLFAV